MGREVKRVAIDFNWPIGMVWKGYLSPYRPQECKPCGGTGLAPGAKRLRDSWYKHLDPDRVGWGNHLTQEDVDALVAEGRLMDFTRRPRTPEQAAELEKTGGYWMKESNGYTPTAEEVNEWNRRGFGHDGINASICVEARAKREGLEYWCEWCSGEGDIWHTPEIEAAAEAWEGFGPPEGEGYQLWSTTSEGHPMTPVLATPEELAKWCVDNDVSTMGHDTAPYETWLAFIKGSGWALSMVGTAGEVVSGVEFATKD